MKKGLFYFLLLLALAFSSNIYSQGVGKFVTGIITDESGAPVIGATIMSSSIDGAIFNGAIGSTLWVDEMQLFYESGNN